MSHSPTDLVCFLAFITLAVQSSFYLSPLGQELVAKYLNRDILLQVNVLQIDYPCDILTPSVLKGGRRAKAVWEDFVQVQSNVALLVILLLHLYNNGVYN